MKVQWRLINVEDGKMMAAIGEPFDLEEKLFKEEWERQFKGTSKIKNPRGILNWMRKKSNR